MELWIQEHGEEYDIPAEILALVKAGKLFDQSWHNDACPSFSTQSDGYGRRIFVEMPKAENRENPDWPRYNVMDDDETGRSDTVYYGDDLAAAIAALGVK